jgi:hypothetical protein
MIDDRAMVGKIAGMFWRFLVADDPEVDAWVVRDSDSRLNAREKAAVDEWLASGASIHVMRDHPNHKRPINAGMFGGRRDALKGKSMAGLVRAWRDKKAYGGDLRFLNRVVWPLVKRDQLGHDAYFCTEFLNSKSFPTKRPANFQHVGQVFDADDAPRMDDIDRFMRKRPAPRQCRREASFKFG